MSESFSKITLLDCLPITIIHSDSLKKEVIKDIVIAIKSKYTKLEKFFQVSNVDVTIFVFADQLSLHIFACGSVQPSWMVGFGGDKKIMILDPSTAEQVGKTYQDMIKTVVHELVHVFSWHNNCHKLAIMTEGIAEHFAERYNYEDIKHLARNINNLSDKTFKLWLNAKTSEELGSRQGGYLAAYTIIEYIIRTYGAEKLKEYFFSKDVAPFENLNVEPSQFIEGWKNFLRETYL
jgi:hypothetical protein